MLSYEVSGVTLSTSAASHEYRFRAIGISPPKSLRIENRQERSSFLDGSHTQYFAPYFHFI